MSREPADVQTDRLPTVNTVTVNMASSELGESFSEHEANFLSFGVATCRLLADWLTLANVVSSTSLKTCIYSSLAFVK